MDCVWIWHGAYVMASLWMDWEVKPKSAWNYGLQISESTAQLSEVPRSTKTGKSIFSLEGARLGVEVVVKRSLNGEARTE